VAIAAAISGDESQRPIWAETVESEQAQETQYALPVPALQLRPHSVGHNSEFGKQLFTANWTALKVMLVLAAICRIRATLPSAWDPQTPVQWVVC